MQQDLRSRGISVAEYVVGQERRLVDPPSQVVAGVRTVTTKLNGRCDPHVAVPILFFAPPQDLPPTHPNPFEFDSGLHFGVNGCSMDRPFAIFSSRRKFLVVHAALVMAMGVGGCHRQAGNKANANGAATSTANTNPEASRREAQTLLDQGKVLYQNDRDEEAAKAFEEAVRLQPELAEAHLRLGMAYAALERKPEADESYKKAVELYKKKVQSDPRDAGAFFNLGEAHSFRHQDEEAARAYRQATRLKPDDEEAFYQLGMAETRLAHYPEATTAFQKALELDPEDYRATDGIENAREGAKRVKEGRKHAEEMLKQQKGNENVDGSANANGNSNGNKKGNRNGNSNSNRRPASRRSPANPG